MNIIIPDCDDRYQVDRCLWSFFLLFVRCVITTCPAFGRRFWSQNMDCLVFILKTLLELQYRFGEKALKLQVIFPQLSPKRDCSPKRLDGPYVYVQSTCGINSFFDEYRSILIIDQVVQGSLLKPQPRFGGKRVKFQVLILTGNSLSPKRDYGSKTGIRFGKSAALLV